MHEHGKKYEPQFLDAVGLRPVNVDAGSVETTPSVILEPCVFYSVVIQIIDLVLRQS